MNKVCDYLGVSLHVCLPVFPVASLKMHLKVWKWKKICDPDWVILFLTIAAVRQHTNVTNHICDVFDVIHA